MDFKELTETGNRGCKDPKTGACKARFPRETHFNTKVDPESGALLMKKGEAWLNGFTLAVAYMLKCNNDVTSLLSGTAMKSVIAYVADYITKTPLKTHVLFQSVQKVFERNGDIFSSNTKIVNALMAASEIGGPMVVMYLLGNPDHYTSHRFRVCYWKGYMYEVIKAWPDSPAIGEEGQSKVMLGIKSSKTGLAQSSNQIVAISPIMDYVYRPPQFEHMSLYDWICRSDKKKMPKRKTWQKPGNTKTVLTLDVTCDSEFEDNYEIDPIMKGEGPKTDKLVEVETNDELLLIAESNGACEEVAANHTLHAHEGATSGKSHCYLFMEDHPQYSTHHVNVLSEDDAYVPNFVGGSLPRKDKGSREEYAVAMLTLFKPWRSGTDLQASPDITWDESFSEYNLQNENRS